jgi:hypothetical protein
VLLNRGSTADAPPAQQITQSDQEGKDSHVAENHHSHNRRHHASHIERPKSILGSAAPYLNLASIVLLVLGAAMYFIAQLYGVQAFVQSAPDNGGM